MILAMFGILGLSFEPTSSWFPSSYLPRSSSSHTFSIILIRHSDKPLNSTATHYIHLSPLGRLRAQHWAETGLKPKHLIARSPESPKYVLREIETLKPLSSKLKIPIEQVGINDTFIPSLLKEGVHQKGLIALICWEHYNFASLCRKLGSIKRSEYIEGEGCECPEQVESWPWVDFTTAVEFMYVVEEGRERLVDIIVDKKIGKIKK